MPTQHSTFNLQHLCGFTGLWDDELLSESSQCISAPACKLHSYSLAWTPLPQVWCVVPPPLWNKMLHIYHRTTNRCRGAGAAFQESSTVSPQTGNILPKSSWQSYGSHRGVLTTPGWFNNPERGMPLWGDGAVLKDRDYWRECCSRAACAYIIWKEWRDSTLSMWAWETNPESNKGTTLKFCLNFGQTGLSNTSGKPNRQKILGDALQAFIPSHSHHFTNQTPTANSLTNSEA